MTRNSLKQASRGRPYLYWLTASLGAAIAIWGLMLWTSVPKLQASDDALKTVDALFTAVNARDSKRMAECKAKLESYAKQGGLSVGAIKALVTCCEQAQAGDWEKAAKRLYYIIDKQ